MRIAVDLDGTLDASEATRHLVRELHKRGHKVSVLTGSHMPVTPEVKAEKKAKLEGLGMKGHYDKLKVYSNPPGEAKAKYCREHNVHMLIDNSMMNAQLAPDSTTVLVPWKTLTN